MPGTYPFNLGRGGAHLKKMGIYMDEVWRVIGGAIADGRVFYVNGVDGVGSNSNAGDKPSLPLLTITEALSKCVANRGDIIIVLDYWQPTGETWPILVNKHQVHILGMSLPNLMYPALHPPDDTAVFEIANTGQYSEIAGFMIGGGNAHGGIETGSIANGMGNGLYVHNCWLGHSWFGTPLAGFRNLGTINACGIRLERITFLSDQANCSGKITGTVIDNALGAAGYFDNCEIINCDFFGASMAIDFYRARDCKIIGNRFIVPDVADGEAITLRATDTKGNMIDKNVAMAGGDGALTKNPFRDLAATQNHWGQNFAGAAVAALPKST